MKSNTYLNLHSDTILFSFFSLYLTSLNKCSISQYLCPHGYLPFKNTYSQHVLKGIFTKSKAIYMSNTFYNAFQDSNVATAKLWGDLCRFSGWFYPPHPHPSWDLRDSAAVAFSQMRQPQHHCPSTLAQFSIIVMRLQSLFLFYCISLFWV